MRQNPYRSNVKTRLTPTWPDVAKALKFLTIAELARLCDVHYLTAWRWAHGLIPRSRAVKRIIRLFCEGRTREERLKFIKQTEKGEGNAYYGGAKKGA